MVSIACTLVHTKNATIRSISDLARPARSAVLSRQNPHKDELEKIRVYEEKLRPIIAL